MNRDLLCIRPPPVGLVFLSLMVGACARSAPSLPGDSVTANGHITLSPSRSAAVQPSVEPPGAIESRLYPPELIMEHQVAIGLDPSTRESIDREVQHTQSELVGLEWELQAEKERLASVLDAERVDEAQAKEVSERLMQRENRVKAAHLAMLVRVKILLAPAQQAKLRTLRDAERCGATSAR